KKDTGKIIYLKGGKITKKVAEKTFLQYEQELITALQ
ncbi:leukotoxin-activating lysine-acyltransferase LktC, partial [Xanthomonas citri pv. citri]|nr:leukotoxin-activating lysine-acyltransferase LktC [Xanthomonas citri pv. citri]